MSVWGPNIPNCVQVVEALGVRVETAEKDFHSCGTDIK